jgi:predicted Zn-dependent peptidase
VGTTVPGGAAAASRPFPASPSLIRTSTLDCGIRLVTEPMPEVRSLSVGCWIGTGSRDESAGQEGVSHLLEHLLFKGTPQRSAREIAEAVDAVGGDMNAYTTKEYTTFYVRTLARDADLGLDIMVDILRDPALRPDEVDAERQVVLEEVAMHLDEPADMVQERAAEALFPSHPLGREILGDPGVIASVTVDQLRAFFEDHYRPGNIVVSAAGELDHDQLAEGLNRRFDGWSGGARPVRSAPSAPLRRLDVTNRDTEQAHLVVGVRAPSRRAPERFALDLVNHALGGGVSSRLFQKVREERGLAYSISSERAAFEDAGTLTVSVGTAPERALEVLGLVRAELDAIAGGGITARELEVAKGNLSADVLLSLEDSGARMSRIGGSLLLHGEVLTVDDVLARIDAVTLDEAAAVAAAVIGGDRSLAAVGPFDEGELAPASA